MNLFSHPSLRHAFEAQARTSPNARAVGSPETGWWTMGELDAWAEIIADGLRAFGVTAGDRVALALRRSPVATAVMMAVWKLGAAYVPLDRNAPWLFQRFIIEDSGAKTVVGVRDEPCGELPSGCRLFEATALTSIAPRAAAATIDPVPFDPQGEAWVLYTSGSTGRPKGVMGTHRGSLNRCRWLWRSQPFEPGEVAVQNTALTVVDSVWEIWGPLAQGIPVLLPAPQAALDPTALVALLASCEVTRICLVPTFLRVLLDTIDRLGEALPKLRTWVCSGEPLDQALAARFHRAARDAVLLNQYGLTETCADVTFHVVSAPGGQTPHEGGITPVGRAIDGVELRVADETGHANRPGEIGELWVAGEALAAGYVGLPDLTAQRFVVRDEAGARRRWLRTGDLARMEADGVVTLLGRIDRQVKVRGLRVELEGVEAALASHAGVQSCAVIQATDGERRLVGYATARRDYEGLDGLRLRAFLSDRLPGHMVPSLIMVLPRFPLTQSGKIDYAALPDIRNSHADRASMPSDTPLRLEIASLWANLLNAKSIGADDEFFALGGDSLLLIRMLAELARRYGVRIAPSTFFEHPTVAGIARLIEEEGASSEIPSHAPAIKEEARGPTVTQAMIWLQERATEAAGLYNVSLAFEVEGAVDEKAISVAIRSVAEAHDSLCTGFRATPTGLFRATADDPADPFAVRDMIGDDESRILAAAEAEAHRPFDLERGPLIRALLILRGHERAIFVLTMHHLACDGVSVGLVLRALRIAYAAAKAGRKADLDISSITQWSAFSRRVAVVADAPDAGAVTFSIASDRPRSRRNSGRGAVMERMFDAARLAGIEQAARRLGISMFVFTLAAFARTAQAHSNEPIVTVRIPLADRFSGSDDRIVGCLMRVVQLTFDLSDDPTFLTLADRVQTALWQAHASDSPETQTSSQWSGLIFTFDDLHDDLALEDLRVRRRSLPRRAAIADLFLSINRSTTRWVVQAEYATDLFNPATIREFLDHYDNILDAAVAQPKQRCSALCAVDEMELAALLNAGAGSRRTDYPLAHTLDRMLEQSIRRNPGGLATFAGATMTHREILDDADHLAAALQRRRIGVDDVVGIHLDRSFDQIEAIFAVLRAGATYLPLEPEQPIARLHQFVEDAGAVLVITRPQDVALWPRKGVSLAALRAEPRDVSRPAACSTPDSRAYVIFTSGSTGRPNGVAVSHRAIVNELTWMLETFPLRRGDCYLHKTSIGFDVSVWGLFLPFLSGAKIEIAEPGGHRSMDYLACIISDADVTVADFVPSVLQLFVEHIAQHGTARRLSRLFCIGEALPAALAARAREIVADEVHNLYGPTEATVHVTWEAFESGADVPTVPIGRPIANTQVYVLDSFGAPVPVGVPGELFIGGIQVAEGYVSRPELTGERFPPDRFRGSGRLYRTGDLVKWRRDMRLEYLGRRDRQVKIAGTRLEPAEIEAVLRTHPDLSDAFVVLKAASGKTQLVAYVIPRTGGTPHTAALQAHARDRLPSSAVPSSFISLAAFPRLSNGKIDANALPVPALPEADESTPVQSQPGDRRRTAILLTLALAAGAPMREDYSFVQCGGDSFGAMRAVAALKRTHGLSVSPYGLLQAAKLSEFLDLLEAGEEERWQPRFSVTETESVENAPTSLQQERWFSLADYGVVDLYCEIEGSIRLDILGAAMRSLVRRHWLLSSVFCEGEPPRQIAIDAGDPISCKDLSDRSEAEARAAIAAALGRCRHLFDIGRDPPIALQALKLSEQRTLLLGRLHHIATDGWSNSLLLDDFAAAYREIERTGTDDRPPPRQYADFACTQRAFMESPEADEIRSWWKKRFAGIAAPTRLPRRAGGAANGHPDRAQAIVEMLTPAARSRLEEVARARSGTLFVALLGAFALLMRDATGEMDVVFGTSLAGRYHPGTEQMLGVFANPLPVRARIEADSDLDAVFEEICDWFADMSRHQDYALVPLLKDVPGFAGLGMNDVFDAHIVFQNYPAPSSAGACRYRVIDPQDGNLREVWGCPLGESRIMRPLDLIAFDRPDGSVSLNFFYKSALLEPGDVRAWVGAFIARLNRFAQLSSPAMKNRKGGDDALF